MFAGGASHYNRSRLKPAGLRYRVNFTIIGKIDGDAPADAVETHRDQMRDELVRGMRLLGRTQFLATRTQFMTQSVSCVG